MPDESVSAVWLEALRTESAAALVRLFESHRGRLRRMLEVRLDRRVRSRIEPDDVLQEAYLDAANRLPDYLADPRVPVYVWLRGLVFQRMVTAQRSHLAVKGRAVTREQATAGFAVADSMAGLLVGGLTSPTAAVDRQEKQDRVRAALDAMDPLDREVLALRHFEELSNADAAAVLGIAPAAASKRHVRALKRLKEVLGTLTPP